MPNFGLTDSKEILATKRASLYFINKNTRATKVINHINLFVHNDCKAILSTRYSGLLFINIDTGIPQK